MTRDDILVAAAHIFRQKGYHAASMQDIARAVNLQKPSLYHHISSKQELLLALLDQALDLLIERLTQVTEGPGSPTGRLRLAIRTYLHALTEEQDLAAVLLLEHRSLQARLRARHIPRRDAFEALWQDLVKSGIEAGEFAAHDPDLTAKALLGVMNWTVTWYRPDGSMTATEIADHLANLFLRGLQSRPEGGGI